MLTTGTQIITLTLQPTRAQTVDAAPQYLNFAIDTINLQTAGHFVFPSDITLSGQAQSNTRSDIMAITGEGWYDRESDGAADWRWAQSPAVIWVYSDRPRQVTLDFTPVLLHEPASPNRLGDEGLMSIGVNASSPVQIPVRVKQRASTALELDPGWNRLTVALATGNFLPAEIGLPDNRSLSFALKSVDLH
jgi:hypothetical protein